MHDPLVVAWEIPAPWLHRARWRDAREGQPRWVERRRRTNPKNFGEPVYRWWRLRAWEVRFAGRGLMLGRSITIWHVEPEGKDSGEVCRHYGPNKSRWRWHVWHWRLQIHLLQKLKRRLFERCIECGRGYPWGYAPVSHQWDGPKSRWFRRSRDAYHHECSSLVMFRRSAATDEELIRHLFGRLAVESALGEAAMLHLLTDPKGRAIEFPLAYRLTRLLGYERDEGYRLIEKVGR